MHDLTFQTLQEVTRQHVKTTLGLSELPSPEGVEKIEGAYEALAESVQGSEDVVAFNQALIDFLSSYFPGSVSSFLSHQARYKDDIPRVLEVRHKDVLLLRGAVTAPEEKGIMLTRLKKSPVKVDLPDFKAIYSVKNDETYEKHLSYVYENPGCEIKYLYHCSSTENWASIIANGLKSRPSTVTVHGKALGEGVYFSDSISGLRTSFMSQNGMFTDDLFVNGRFFGIYEAALTGNNHASRGGEICVFHEDAVYLKYLVELWAL